MIMFYHQFKFVFIRLYDLANKNSFFLEDDNLLLEKVCVQKFLIDLVFTFFKLDIIFCSYFLSL
jgi:hypothetical protein